MPCCSQTNGLGQIDPATILAVQEAFVHAKDLWEDIEKIFGIGAGRHEADVIVPLQNQVTQQILAPVGDFLERVRTNQVVATCAECTTWRTQLVAAETKWVSYLHTTQWQDGRAAQQAEATLAPIFKSQKDELQLCINAKCGVVGGGGGPIPIITNPDGSINWPIVAAGAGLLYALMKK
jgi:hypothetical protein